MKKLTIKTTGGKRISISVEIADTLPKKIAGLMFKKHLPEKQGMLFVFEEEWYPGFWMLFTPLPLEALFFNAGKKLVDVVPMQPNTTKVYKPKAKAKYVLEVNKGFSELHQIKIRSKVEF